MIVYNNQSGLTNVYLGSTNIAKVYVSTYQVYPTITPPFNGKFKAEYSNHTSFSAECDENTALTTATTKPSGYEYSAMTSCIIGQCVDAIGDDAFFNCYNITSIEIPSGVTTIGSGAFSQCSGLTSINIPSGVTSINNSTFNNCSSLTSITIPSGVTTIDDYAFNYCRSLTSINIPDGVTSIGQAAFNVCDSLTSITIPDSVTSIGWLAFYDCTGLTSIICNALTPPTLSSRAFDDTSDCPIYVPCQSVEAYKTAWSAYASRIQCVTPPVFDVKWKATYSDSHVESAQCDGSSAITKNEIDKTLLVSVEIGDCVTSIGNDAFYNYAYISSVILSNSVTTINSRAFAQCNAMSSCTIPSSVTTIGDNAFNQCYSLTSLNIPDSVTTIGQYSFYQCSGATSVTIGSGVTSIGQNAFYGCSGLTAITCDATTPPTLSNMYSVFGNTNNCPIYVPCESVEAYKTAWSAYESRIQCVSPSFDGKFKAEYSGGTSYSADCDGNTSLTTATTRPSGYEYTAMTSAIIGDCVTSIANYPFQYCYALTSVTIPDSVTSIDYSAFDHCYSLTNINIPSGVTSIGNGAFTYCSGLTSVDIPSGVTTIGRNTFQNCRSLTSVTVPSGITSIGQGAFQNCGSLQSITIPSGVTDIGADAFNGCSGLTSITCNAVTPPTLVGYYVFDNTNNCPVYVPSGSVETYRTTRYWDVLGNRIQAIPNS